MEGGFYIQACGRRKLVHRKVCTNCNMDYWSPLSVRSKFCSQECTQEYDHVQNSIKLECAYCGNIFLRAKSKLKNSKSGLYFCNKKCKGIGRRLSSGLTDIQPPHYGTTNCDYRGRAITNFEHCCSNPTCELTKRGVKMPLKMLDVDHIDNDRSNNSLDNLQFLCVWCHATKTRKTW